MGDATKTLDLSKIADLRFAHGAHDTRGRGKQKELCIMEAVAWVAGEKHSDHPACVSPVIAAALRSWNDSLSDPPRTELLKPLVPHIIGTATTAEDEETRAWMATDWLVRVHTPACLRLAGLTKEAENLEALARIVDAVTARSAQPSLDAARSASAAA
ncbi:MAG TPA: hypothetical protein VN717_08625, partial [Gemmatimonadaceae bacterium]|nr:hypothetical protein [Gemmatimonadaceae bacterium]